MASKSMGGSGFEVGVENRSRQADLNLPERPLTMGLDAHPAELLAQLSVLLEQYAPSWYAEDLRHRVLLALRLPTDVLVELCALLEDHAPTWYTEQQRSRTLGTLQALGILEPEPTDESK